MSNQCTNGTGERGMTLVELIIAVAISVILVAMGIPAMQTMTQNNRLSTETNRFIADMMLARSEAVKRQYEVAGCPSANGTSCADSNAYWLLFVDDDEDGVDEASDGNGSRDADETILLAQPGLSAGQSLELVGGVSIIAFTPDGMVKGSAAINAKLKDSRNEFKCIQIAISGRASVVDKDGDDCPGF